MKNILCVFALLIIVMYGSAQGKPLVKDISKTFTNQCQLTFKTSSSKFYLISVPEKGDCGIVSRDNSITITVDKNTSYQFVYSIYKRTLRGGKGTMKSQVWTWVKSGNGNNIVDLTD